MIDISSSSEQPRSVGQAMARGAIFRCPACGRGHLFSSYLKVADACASCGTELHHHRADDAPPYFTILIIGHFLIGGVLALEQAYAPPSWVHAVIWLPLGIVTSLVLLPIAKGALVGLQWALRMHGFARPAPGKPVAEADGI